MKQHKSILMLAFLASSTLVHSQNYTFDGYTTTYWADNAAIVAKAPGMTPDKVALAESYLIDHDIRSAVLNMDAYNSGESITMSWNNAYRSSGTGGGDIMIFLATNWLNGTVNTMRLILANGSYSNVLTVDLSTGLINTVSSNFASVALLTGNSEILSGVGSEPGGLKILSFSDFGLTSPQQALGVKGIQFVDSNEYWLDLAGVAFTQNVTPVYPVPEPSSAMLLGITASLFLLRRRR